MHQSPQKQIGTRRERNAVYSAFDLADDDDRRVYTGPAPNARRAYRDEEAPRQPRAPRQHPRG